MNSIRLGWVFKTNCINVGLYLITSNIWFSEFSKIPLKIETFPLSVCHHFSELWHVTYYHCLWQDARKTSLLAAKLLNLPSVMITLSINQLFRVCLNFEIKVCQMSFKIRREATVITFTLNSPVSPFQHLILRHALDEEAFVNPEMRENKLPVSKGIKFFNHLHSSMIHFKIQSHWQIAMYQC